MIYVCLRILIHRSSAWSTWSNVNGIADTIRSHLSSKHGDEWRKIVAIEKLKGWDKLQNPEDLSDNDIPHRTKMTRVIFEAYHREWQKLVAELRVRASYT